MLRNIILALVGFVVLALVILWIFNGGPRRVYSALWTLSSATTTMAGESILPWKSPDIFPLITEKDIFAGEGNIDAIFRDAAQGGPEASEVLTYGNPSPQFQSVRIAPFSNPKATAAADEFVVIEASFSNTAPVSLAGWSLQSALSGVRVPISGAASPMYVGAINTLAPVTLNPGASATIVSGASPVGVSFQENRCTGYLAQFQRFEPPLSLQCPAPGDELPLTPDNLQRYGEACFEFARSLPTCEFPQDPPAHLSAECRTFAQVVFSYNGCVNRHYAEPQFSENSWRLYLGMRAELWGNLHDAIRILDAQGQTVDVYVY